ncbi:MAG TPA: GAF domain-containing protein [Desulfobacteraceae bacterium]|nr:GAF domain-containing protein [Desulfobacteraceae bacterium]
MKNDNSGQLVRSTISLEPLMTFWEEHLVPQCSEMASLYSQVRETIDGHPEISQKLQEGRAFKDHYDILKPLMTALFPLGSFDREIMGALKPCTLEPFFVTPEFQRIFLDNEHLTETVLEKKIKTETEQKRLKIFLLILDRKYGISCRRLESVEIKTVPDQKTGLTRYFGFTSDFRFLRISSLSPVKELSDQDRKVIRNNLTNVRVLEQYIDLDQFEFSGFTLVRALDVTESEVVSALERDLIEEHSIFSARGIQLLEKRLHTLFQRRDIFLGIGAIQDDQILMIKSDCPSNINCLFSNSRHIPLDEIQGSVWTRAVQGDETLRIANLSQKEVLVPAEKQAVTAGIRSMLLSPLTYHGKTIGLVEIFTAKPDDLGPFETSLLEQVIPIFSVALKRGLEEMDKQVQSIIKEKCTAVHPSVEWRFERAAMGHMERLRNGETNSEMEPIIFKDVVPFYGQTDIRGSSKARNSGIQADLSRQLHLALDIVSASEAIRPWPILKEFTHRIKTRLDQINQGVTSGDENGVADLLHHELGPVFDDLEGLDRDVAEKVKHYKNALDPASGMVYNKRKEYEESVSQLNQALSAHMDREDSLVQENFPHYFEKRQTDGLDYMMYIGASMNKNQDLSRFHIQNMTLWQLMLAWGMARETEKIKPGLKVPLDVCHLILVNHTPLSIRFRFDEKRFDVDGAYDVRHEIIKSRLDKALVKGSKERLTQPGRIAVVYSNPEEEKEIRRHIDFLTSQGSLCNDMEHLDLDDMPDVRGMKAIRVGVDLAARADNVVEMKFA